MPPVSYVYAAPRLYELGAPLPWRAGAPPCTASGVDRSGQRRVSLAEYTVLVLHRSRLVWGRA